MVILLDPCWELSLTAARIFKEPYKKKRHKIVICLEKIICAPNGTKLPLKWLILKRREQFFFLLPMEEQLSRRGMQELMNGTASQFIAYINRRSPQSNQTFWGWVIAPKQVRILVSTNQTLLEKKDPARKRVRPLTEKTPVMDLKEAETYKAHPALSASHRGKD